MLYIYCFKLPNGTFRGGIWKHRQYVPFPRMILSAETIQYFELTTGYAYIRKLDLSAMNRPYKLTVTKYPQILEEQHLWSQRKLYQEGKG